jgi:hypothetical protein
MNESRIKLHAEIFQWGKHASKGDILKCSDSRVHKWHTHIHSRELKSKMLKLEHRLYAMFLCVK